MNNKLTPEMLVRQYDMQPHPEGGYFKETYRCAELLNENALPERFCGGRNISTAIYFLLAQRDFSAFHRIKSDECWHFYAGETLLVHVLHANGELQTVRLGNNPVAREVFQFVVPAGCWFASEPAPHTSYSFVGCTVAPGFDFQDFEMADAGKLSSEYPRHSDIIQRLAR